VSAPSARDVPVSDAEPEWRQSSGDERRHARSQCSAAEHFVAVALRLRNDRLRALAVRRLVETGAEGEGKMIKPKRKAAEQVEDEAARRALNPIVYAHLRAASDYGADYTASVPARARLPNCPTDISAKRK
jgi:hypothetical protein